MASNKKGVIKANFKIYKSIKDYPNMLSPLNEQIIKMGLHWDSHKVLLINKHEKTISSFLNDEINISDLKKEIADDQSFESLLRRMKSVREINSLFKQLKYSKSTTNKIEKLLSDENIFLDDLSYLVGVIYSKMFSEKERRDSNNSSIKTKK